MRRLSAVPLTLGVMLLLLIAAREGNCQARAQSASSAPNADQLQEARRLYDRARELYQAGKYSEAIPLAERTLVIEQRVLGKQHRDCGSTLGLLGLLYDSMGQYAKAEPLFLQAMEIYKKTVGEDHPHYAASLNNLAGLYESMGQHAKAEPLYLQAMEIQRKAGLEDAPTYAASLNNLANLYESMGQYVKAEPLYLQAMEIKRKAGLDDAPTYATSLSNLAGLYAFMGQYVKAEPLYLQAMEIKRKAGLEDHPHYATSLNNLALLYVSMGQYVKAEPLYLQAMEIYRKAGLEDSPDYATSLSNLAGLYESMGQYAKAEPLVLQAMEIERKAGLEDAPTYATSLNSLASLLAACERWQEASELFEQERQARTRHARRVLPVLAEQEQLRFLKENYNWSVEMAAAYARLRQSDRSAVPLGAGWAVNGKGLAAETLAARLRLARRAEGAGAKQTLEELFAARAQIANLTVRGPQADSAAYASQRQQLAEREDKLSKQLGRNLGDTWQEEAWIELAALRAALPAGAACVELMRYDDFNFKATGQEKAWGDARYAAWVIPAEGGGKVRMVDLGPADAIEEAVAELLAVMHTISRTGQVTGQVEMSEKLAAVSRLILQPLEPALREAPRWLICPDGALWLVPWAALPMTGGSYALEKHRISYLATARDLVRPVSMSGTPGPALVMADPDYELAPNDVLARSRRRPAKDEFASRGAAVRAGEQIPTDWARLSGTANELESIRAPLAGYLKSDPEVYTGAECLEAAFKQAVSPRVVVMSTHGFFLRDQETKRDDAMQTLGMSGPRSGQAYANPLLRCGLVLAGANQRNRRTDESIDDGILTGMEIVGTDLRGTELVVLSACDTAVGEVRIGDGVADLRRAFQLAGAESVVATLWKIPDRETTELMTAFWGNLAAGQNRADALRDAQLAMIKKLRSGPEQAAHPYYWAAFTLTGDPGPGWEEATGQAAKEFQREKKSADEDGNGAGDGTVSPQQAADTAAANEDDQTPGKGRLLVVVFAVCGILGVGYTWFLLWKSRHADRDV